MDKVRQPSTGNCQLCRSGFAPVMWPAANGPTPRPTM
jgi:hypothetical protein